MKFNIFSSQCNFVSLSHSVLSSSGLMLYFLVLVLDLKKKVRANLEH
jgi:hypothetical protein